MSERATWPQVEAAPPFGPSSFVSTRQRPRCYHGRAASGPRGGCPLRRGRERPSRAIIAYRCERIPCELHPRRAPAGVVAGKRMVIYLPISQRGGPNGTPTGRRGLVWRPHAPPQALLSQTNGQRRTPKRPRMTRSLPGEGETVSPPVVRPRQGPALAPDRRPLPVGYLQRNSPATVRSSRPPDSPTSSDGCCGRTSRRTSCGAFEVRPSSMSGSQCEQREHVKAPPATGASSTFVSAEQDRHVNRAWPPAACGPRGTCSRTPSALRLRRMAGMPSPRLSARLRNGGDLGGSPRGRRSLPPPPGDRDATRTEHEAPRSGSGASRDITIQGAWRIRLDG
jgi:hypothetical protein